LQLELFTPKIYIAGRRTDASFLVLAALHGILHTIYNGSFSGNHVDPENYYQKSQISHIQLICRYPLNWADMPITRLPLRALAGLLTADWFQQREAAVEDIYLNQPA
jgi:hypothetical protein